MTQTKKPRSIFLLPEHQLKLIYNSDTVQEICGLTANDGGAYGSEDILGHPQDFSDVEIIFSGWWAPVLDEALLNCLPNLKAFFYGAGSVRGIVTDAFWERQILLTSSYKANAVPVADFTMASVIFGLKSAWRHCASLKSGVAAGAVKSMGVYHGSKVGVISLGAIGQLVCERLTRLELDVSAYDPFAPDSLFEALGVQRVAKLEDLFSSCNVVTLHAPWLPETENLVTGKMIELLPNGATFINTSRGAIVEEAGMLEALKERPDLFAVLDLLQDEKTFHTNPLTALPNVFITPHIAGSQGYECHRMGSFAVEECRRYLNGEPPITGITREIAKHLA
jgi:phosphoglycerate dehydrogenase-like enzyme